MTTFFKVIFEANHDEEGQRQEGQGRRKLPFFVDPIQHKLMIEKDDLLSAYFKKQVEAQRNLRPP